MGLLGLTILLGLLSRSFLFTDQSPVHQYAGDALWAMAVFWSLAIVCPNAPTSRHAIGALLISFAVETSQLYRADWIGILRGSRLGALFLGNEFRWADIACYTAGVCLAATLNHFILRKETKKETKYELDS